MKFVRRAPYNRELIVLNRVRVPYAPAYGWRSFGHEILASTAGRWRPAQYLENGPDDLDAFIAAQGPGFPAEMERAGERMEIEEAERQRIWAAVRAWTEVAHRLDEGGRPVAVAGTEFRPLAPFFDELHVMIFGRPRRVRAGSFSELIDRCPGCASSRAECCLLWDKVGPCCGACPESHRQAARDDGR
jgi:hypothetical protein